MMFNAFYMALLPWYLNTSVFNRFIFTATLEKCCYQKWESAVITEKENCKRDYDLSKLTYDTCEGARNQNLVSQVPA